MWAALEWEPPVQWGGHIGRLRCGCSRGGATGGGAAGAVAPAGTEQRGQTYLFAPAEILEAPLAICANVQALPPLNWQF